MPAIRDVTTSKRQHWLILSPPFLSLVLGDEYSPGVNWSSLRTGSTDRLSTGVYVSGVRVPRIFTGKKELSVNKK